MRLSRAARLLFPLFREIGSASLLDERGIDIDRRVARYLHSHGMTSAMIGYRGFPAHCAVSANDVAVHGVPGARRFSRGDLFTLDIAARSGGWVTDTAWTYVLDGSPPRAAAIARAAWRVMVAAAQTVRAGATLGEIREASERAAARDGVAIFPTLVGHGIGRDLHEAPVISFTREGDGAGDAVSLPAGALVNIEPVVSDRGTDLTLDHDGWGYRVKDGGLTAHYEVTVLVEGKGGTVLQLGEIDAHHLPDAPPFGIALR